MASKLLILLWLVLVTPPAFASLCDDAWAVLLGTVGLDIKIKSVADLKRLERDLSDIWDDDFRFIGTAMAMRVALQHGIKGLVTKETTVYRGMWITTEELTAILNNGMEISKVNSSYQGYMFFGTDPAEAVRYGVQGAAGKEKPRGLIVLFAADSESGGIKRRPRPQSNELMSNPTAVADVPASSIRQVWVYDPDAHSAFQLPMRTVNLPISQP